MFKKVVVTTKDQKAFPYIKQLPDWFNLQNYRNASQLSLEGWITQLYFRQMVEGHFLPIIFAGIIDDATVPSRSYEASSLPVQPISQHDAVLIVEAVKSALPVPAEVWEAPSLFDFFKNTEKKRASEQPSSLLSWLQNQHQEKKIDLTAPIATEDTVRVLDKFISVDLNAPDSILIAAFKAWLRQRRDKMPKYQGRHFSKAILQRWVGSQALPYIDLCRWAQLNSVQIPHWLMAEALFPYLRQGDPVDKVRKTTEKLAKNMMLASCLQAMAAQLQHENGKILIVDAIVSDPLAWDIKCMIKIENCV